MSKICQVAVQQLWPWQYVLSQYSVTIRIFDIYWARMNKYKLTVSYEKKNTQPKTINNDEPVFLR